MDLFTYDEVIIPINLKNHWIFAIAEMRSKTVHIYDSYVTYLAGCHDAIMKNIISFLKDASELKSLEDDEWKADIQTVPQQLNSTDCGFFACRILDFVSRGLTPDFVQQDIPYFKKLMAYEISSEKLIM